MEIDKIIYKAKDGRTFFDPLECEEYEKTVGIVSGSVGDMINILEKNCKNEQYVSGILLIKGNEKSHIYVRYTGCIDHKLEDYVSVDNLTEEQRYESATIGELLNKLKQIDKDLPCQYMIAYSDHIDMRSPGIMANFNRLAWNDNDE